MKFLAHTAATTAGIAVLVPVLLMVPTRAVASTIPFTDAFLATLNPDSYAAAAPAFDTSPYVQSEVQNAGNPPPPSTNTQQVSSPTWGSTSVSASANLVTGILGGEASATYTGSSGPEVYAQSNASFGDGFRTTTTGGQPFTWGPNDTATFNFTVDGTLTSSFPTIDTVGGAFILLQLYQKDTLNPNNAFGIQPNDIPSATYLFLLGNPNQSLEFCDTAGDPDSCEILTPTASYTDLSQPVDISQTITPGGDFDWLVLLGEDGALSPVTGPGSFDFDLAHTITVGYQGPPDTTTLSVSGEFQNFDSTSPVPEPGTLLLLGSGAAGLLARRNRRKGTGSASPCRHV